jgi:hypothetical protein
VTAYAQRRAIEETWRAWHPGWGVRTAVVALPSPTMVDRLLGGVCLTSSLQRQLGQRLRAAPHGPQRRRQWTGTDRVRWCGCGQRLCKDSGYDWRAWLAAPWAALNIPQALVVSQPAPIPILGEAVERKGGHSLGNPAPWLSQQ